MPGSVERPRASHVRHETVAPVFADHYDLHGVAIRVVSDLPEVSAAIRSRLCPWATGDRPRADLTFDFRSVPDDGPHPVKPVGRATRKVEEADYSAAEDLLFIDYADQVRVACDPVAGETRVSIRRSAAANAWLLTQRAFLLPLIESLKRRGWFHLHAAGLAVDGRTILFPAAGGSGKSTLSIALVRAGFGFVGDDVLLVRAAGPAMDVCALSDTISATRQTLAMFDELAPIRQGAAADRPRKITFSPEIVYGPCFVRQSRPAAIVLPRWAPGRSSELAPADAGEALWAFLSGMLVTEPAAAERQLGALAGLVAATPCYRLTTGQDFDVLPSLLRELL